MLWSFWNLIFFVCVIWSVLEFYGRCGLVFDEIGCLVYVWGFLFVWNCVLWIFFSVFIGWFFFFWFLKVDWSCFGYVIDFSWRKWFSVEVCLWICVFLCYCLIKVMNRFYEWFFCVLYFFFFIDFFWNMLFFIFGSLCVSVCVFFGWVCSFC